MNLILLGEFLKRIFFGEVDLKYEGCFVGGIFFIVGFEDKGGYGVLGM